MLAFGFFVCGSNGAHPPRIQINDGSNLTARTTRATHKKNGTSEKLLGTNQNGLCCRYEGLLAIGAFIGIAM